MDSVVMHRLMTNWNGDVGESVLTYDGLNNNNIIKMFIIIK